MPSIFKSGALIALVLAALAQGRTFAASDSPVTVSDSPDNYVLANGLVTATISKRDGKLVALKYRDVDTVDPVGHSGGYWSHSAASANTATAITIDPKSNDGERAEVAVQGHSGGQQVGSGPGGSTIADIEIRYALERGLSGIYTYSIFNHPADYPATSIGEARFCAKLNDSVFDWMTVDANRNMKMITAYDWDHGTVMNMKEARLMNSGLYKGQVEHKYDYSANQFDVLAWGWSSTEKHIGFWFINPTDEYLSGGPTKMELSAHRDATFGDNPNAPAPPCLLNYWRGSHYGGSRCDIAQGEAWDKVIGPFLIYCNTGATPDAMWKDALSRSKVETTAWPYSWVAGVNYPHAAERGIVSGQLTVKDSQAPDFKFTRLLVGLSAPDYTPAKGGPVDWQHDAKNYEFWVRASNDGSFTIPKVRPGSYTLHAIADGVLGEFAQENVKVTPGQKLALGTLEWKPVRHGRQLWDIGIPNRTAGEFFKGDDYFHWGWYLKYPTLFPNDVHYTIGQSDYRKDWFFEQVPHNEDPANTTGKGEGSATTWTVSFNLPQAPNGTAILRLAICGVGTKTIDVGMNNQPAGSATGLSYNAAINRDCATGAWVERDVTFDAKLMKQGANQLTLTIPKGGLMSGIAYDYLRLELDEATPWSGTPAIMQK
ncbi:MAG: polysaccharide lyase family protein [Chthoniobacteraceae bacterium]